MTDTWSFRKHSMVRLITENLWSTTFSKTDLVECHLNQGVWDGSQIKDSDASVLLRCSESIPPFQYKRLSSTSLLYSK